MDTGLLASCPNKYLGLVTRVIPPRWPEFPSQRGKKAIADEIAEKGYLITSSELADLMGVHSSAVTSRGDEWRWRNWIVSRVRREGNQILWELERVDTLRSKDTQIL